MPKIDIKKTELVWKGKYDDDGKLVPVEKPDPYPFQQALRDKAGIGDYI